MNVAEIENERLQIDNELDGFSDFVLIRSYQNIRIVHRDSKKWQGIIDDMDNIILPLVYDKIELDDNGIRLFLKDENDQYLIGLANIEDLQVVLPARFKALYPLEDLKMIWCLDVKDNWLLYDEGGNLNERLPQNCIPLDNPSFVCVLRKNNADDYSVECRNQKMEVSSRLLRSLALQSESPGRIALSSHYYHILVYTDLYGRILYSNINLDALFNKN